MSIMKYMCALLLLVGACHGLPRYPGKEVCPSPYVCVPEGTCRGTPLETTGSKDWWLLINPRNSRSTCGNSKIPGVCCADSPKYKVANQCGVRNADTTILEIDERIFNNVASNEAKFGEFPWQAGIFFRNSSFKCGASIIGNRWIVTAAHHVVGLRPSDLKIRLGEWQVNNLEEPITHLDVDVIAITIHPEFNANNAHNDIAVLQLSKTVNFQYHINSICLPNPGQKFLGQRCIATGWGKDAFDGNYQQILKKIDLPIVDNQHCESLLQRTRLGRYFYLDDSFMCAGGEEDKNACDGDGGGPLACQDPVTGRYVLAGITAWGIGCGKKDVPGVYADVQALLPFIQSVVKPRFDDDERLHSNIDF